MMLKGIVILLNSLEFFNSIMFLHRVACNGLKFLTPTMLRSSVNEFLLLLSDSKIKGCNFSNTVHLDIFDSVEMQKYLKFLKNQSFCENLQTQNSEQLVHLLNHKENLEEEIKNLEKMSSEGDKELEKLINSEKVETLKSLEEIKNEILCSITPNDGDNDDRNVELKIIPGIGGEEAKLFSKNLLNMYIRYVENKNWEWIHLSNDSILVNGEFVFGYLKHEAGVHRVQRVPDNDNYKRIQSSTCSVVVLPQPKPHEIEIKEKDLLVEKIKSSGPGGQNVNKRETCVRVKHIPSGIVIENQTSRHQYENLKEAIKRIRGILFNIEQDKVMSQRKALRKEQTGTNDYSDKIRTYNFPQNRVTDHRINYSTQNLKDFLSGGKELEYVINYVKTQNSKRDLMWKIKNVLESVEYKTFEKLQNG